MNGRSAPCNSASALRIWPEWPLFTGLYDRMSTDFGYSYLQALRETSFGISTTTGPGRPVDAIKKAFLMVEARSRTSFTRKLCLTIGRVMPTVSHSWKASWPMDWVGTFPVITTIGIESRYAVAIPVTALVTPGPEVTRATPTLPVARA